MCKIYAGNFLCKPWPRNSTMICNVKMKNGDYSGDLGTESYCKDTTLVSIVIAIKHLVVWIGNTLAGPTLANLI